MKDRLNEILALREAHEQYLELLAKVHDLTRRHPRGLAIRPMFGQPARAVVRKLRRAA